MNNNYVSAEEFLNQSDKVKKVLLDWWKPRIGDLFSFKEYVDDKIVFYKSCILGIETINGDIAYLGCSTNDYNASNNTSGCLIEYYNKEKYYHKNLGCIQISPLFNMSQLINFIEEKVKYKIDFRINSNNKYLFYKVNAEENFYHDWLFNEFTEISANNLLEALWQVAIKLIEE